MNQMQILFKPKVIVELRKRAAQETLRTGLPMTASALVRQAVDALLAGKVGRPPDKNEEGD